MNKLITYLTSPTFGFFLKLFAGFAGASFGILGLGTKARDGNGKLTRNGRIALVGILLAGSLGISSLVYDYVVGQQRARSERQRTERLMLSVQRGIYPLRGVKVSFEMELGSDFEPLARYKRDLRDRISRDRDCQRTRPGFNCYGTYGTDDDETVYSYRIYSSSPFFPKDPSPILKILKSLYISVGIYKSTSMDENINHGGDQLTYLGRFFVKCKDPSKDGWLTYDYERNSITFGVDRCAMSDADVAEAGVYSLVDFFPGAIEALAISDNAFCNDLRLNGDPCNNVIAGLNNELRLRNLNFEFSYPKSLSLYEGGIAVRCTTTWGNYLALRLPADIEWLDSLGNIEETHSQNPDPQLCKLIDALKN